VNHTTAGYRAGKILMNCDTMYSASVGVGMPICTCCASFHVNAVRVGNVSPGISIMARLMSV